MADAAIQSPNAPRFFCHKCTQEIHPVLPEYICPRCQCGFIEELTQGSTGNISEESDENFEPVSQVVQLNNMVDALRRRALARNHGLSFPGDRHSYSGISALVSGPFSSRRNDRHGSRPVTFRQASREIFGWNQPVAGYLQPLNAMLAERRRIVTPLGYPESLTLHSNPGDYARGRDDFDAIITEFLNQIDGEGPPPLSKDKLEKIPSVLISQDQVNKHLECTICMEDFIPGEPVKKLSCEHYFHRGCITPWLELHGTCPICRKMINVDHLPLTE